MTSRASSDDCALNSVTMASIDIFAPAVIAMCPVAAPGPAPEPLDRSGVTFPGPSIVGMVIAARQVCNHRRICWNNLRAQMRALIAMLLQVKQANLADDWQTWIPGLILVKTSKNPSATNISFGGRGNCDDVNVFGFRVFSFRMFLFLYFWGLNLFVFVHSVGFDCVCRTMKI